MLNNVCKTPATLRVRVAVRDGAPVWRETSALVAETEYTQRDIDFFGKVTGGKIILLAPPLVPDLPAQIIIGGRVYDIRDIKVCRTLDGVLTGCRMAVV